MTAKTDRYPNLKALAKAGLLLFTLWALFKLVTCSQAHVLVVNQNGQPIEDVLVRSNIQPGNAYFFSDETTVEYTDDDGRATLPVGRWFYINLVEKEGYQFRPWAQFKRDFGDYTFGQSAERFTHDDPLVIQGWKRGEQPDLHYTGGVVYFPDNLEQCTLELVTPDEENGLSEPVVWKFNMETKYVPYDPRIAKPEKQFDADGWKGWFELSNGLLKDTDDLFLNQAPESGYVKKVEIGPFSGYDDRGLDPRKRKIFIKGDTAGFYGAALLFLDPDRTTKPALDHVNRHGLRFQMWFNFSGQSNVMRDERHTAWDSLSDWMEERYRCKEDPR